ncbi:methylcrotonoyl-CoA carboxylase beta chain [Salix suchowensis]|nr:methylcrotonoyl-CoA carboxylase beta chain [Salix suchowensis]
MRPILSRNLLKSIRHSPQRNYHASVLPSLISTSSPEFTAKSEMAQARLGGGLRATERMRNKGKKLPRERYVYPESIPGAGIITGIGRIAGRECVIVVNDATVKGGSYYPLTVKKHLRAQEVAREHGLPCVYIVESGGAALPHQANVFPDKEHFGASSITWSTAQMSALGIPQIAVVHGISVAGGAYVPAMADENIIVQNQGRIFLAGPPLVKTLGGGLMHSSESGVTDHLARDDEHALAIARGIVGDLAFDMRDVIARIVDGSRFREFKKEYGTTMITVRLCPYTRYQVGIVANNGILFSPSALKATHFIQLCSQREIPLLFLVNVTGYMVGSKAEKGGIAKDVRGFICFWWMHLCIMLCAGAKMVRAVACADNRHVRTSCTIPFPFITVLQSLNFPQYSPRFLWMWPVCASIVMGSGQLSQVMTSVSDNPAQHASLEAEIERQSTALYSTARLWDDGIIKPTDTRDVVGLG